VTYFYKLRNIIIDYLNIDRMPDDLNPNQTSPKSNYLIVLLIVLLLAVVGALVFIMFKMSRLQNDLNNLDQNVPFVSSISISNVPSYSPGSITISSLPEMINETSSISDSESISKTMVTFYLTTTPGDDMSNLEQYLEPVKYEVNTANNKYAKTESALEALFSIKKLEYGESGFQNLLYLSDLKVDQVSNQNGKDTVDLSGKLMGIGALADPLMKLQVEKTISEYLDKYVITLNGQAGDWNCALAGYAGCSQSATDDSSPYIVAPLPPMPSDFGKDENGFYSGGLVVRGYAETNTVSEAFCEENCAQYQYISLVITEKNTDKLDDFFQDNFGNFATTNNMIGLGCLADGQIYYANHSDEFGFKDFKLSKELTTSILNATEAKPVTLELDKLFLTGGAGAPTCYSLFTYIK
jgi:hypothetical protein